MTEEQILELLAKVLPDMLKPTTEALLTDVKSFMKESVDPLTARVEAISTAPTAPTKEEPKTPEDSDPLNARVKLLEQQLAQAAEKEAAQAAQAQEMRFNSTLSAELDKLSPLHKSVVQELLSTRLRKDAQEKDGTWLAKDGKNLAETVQDFFKSPEGMHFLPSTHINGVGAKETQTPKTGDNVNIDDAIMSAFL